jgi:uncharacterized protein YciI
MELFVVLRKTGPGWDKTKPVREQRYWDEHAQYIDRLYDEGKIMLAGPFPDGSGAMLVVRTETEQEARRLFDGDIWVEKDMLDRGEVKPWQMFLNGFERHA